MQQVNSAELLKSLDLGDPRSMAIPIEANARIRFTVAQALVQGRIGFHNQPVVQASNPGFPAFFEVLARLTLPNGQVLPAGAFMPQIEAGPLGRAIDRLALSQALRMLAYDPALRLSINLSPRTMGDEGWLAILAAASRGGSGVCGRLILEVTEDAAMGDAAQTVEFIKHVRKTGCALALDDFGAGATGFRHFREFRFDMVKIDGTFAQGIHRSPDSQVLVECLISVARHFEMVTVAERIEAQEDADWLRARGVDCLQGYLYGRPSPLAELSVPQVPPAISAAG